MSRVIVVGSANVDIATRVVALPEPGQTLLAKDATFHPGGKGANQAVAARRFGADTTLYAAIGTDDFGQQLHDALAADGVHLDHVISVTAETTGLAMITVAADGENTIVVAPGANSALAASAVADLDVQLTVGDIVLLQLEVPIETCLAAANAAGRAGARVVLNAAPLSQATAGLDALLRAVDVLVVNETEAATLADRPEPNAYRAWIAVAGSLRRLGPSAAVITLGNRGAVAHDETGGWLQPSFSADVVDTTGAGDAFCGVLAGALADGMSLPEAVCHACAAGALATERVGAQSSLPTRADLVRLIGGPA